MHTAGLRVQHIHPVALNVWSSVPYHLPQVVLGDNINSKVILKHLDVRMLLNLLYQ